MYLKASSILTETNNKLVKKADNNINSPKIIKLSPPK